MKKISFVPFLIFCLIGIASAQEPSTNRKAIPRPVRVATPPPAKEEILQNPADSKLPPPEKGICLAKEFESEQSALAGRIVKIKFNRITEIQKMRKGPWYAGTLRSSEKSDGDIYSSSSGIQLGFTQEGLGFFSKFIPMYGSAQDDISCLIKPDLGEVYVQIGLNEKEPSIAVGDRYRQDGEDGKYEWSEATEVPDLAVKEKVTVDDVLLFPDQLNGKTVVVEFYNVIKSRNKPADQSPVYISCGYGHSSVETSFPPEGKALFKSVEEQNNFPKANRIYATVIVSPAGVLTLEARGRRASGSGDEATYKW